MIDSRQGELRAPLSISLSLSLSLSLHRGTRARARAPGLGGGRKGPRPSSEASKSPVTSRHLPLPRAAPPEPPLHPEPRTGEKQERSEAEMKWEVGGLPSRETPHAPAFGRAPREPLIAPLALNPRLSAQRWCSHMAG